MITTIKPDLSRSQSKGGRGLAPDGGVPVNESVDWNSAIGGKPPPTMDLWRGRCPALPDNSGITLALAFP